MPRSVEGGDSREAAEESEIRRELHRELHKELVFSSDLPSEPSSTSITDEHESKRSRADLASPISLASPLSSSPSSALSIRSTPVTQTSMSSGAASPRHHVGGFYGTFQDDPNESSAMLFANDEPPRWTIPRGLKNLGNTCFMNSALQCVARSPLLTDYFLQNDPRRDGVARQFARLVRELSTLQYHSAFSPWHLKSAIAERDGRFSGYEQQDSQELAAVLLDAIHEDLKAREGLSTAQQQQEHADAWERYLQREDSLVTRAFHGLFRSVVRCGECRRESVAYDPFASLSLPIPAPVTHKLVKRDGNAFTINTTCSVINCEDRVQKEGIWYERIPDGDFFRFYAECERHLRDELLSLEDGQAVPISLVSKPLLLPLDDPIGFLTARLRRVYPDIDLSWTGSIHREGTKLVFLSDLIRTITDDDGDTNPLHEIRSFFDHLFTPDPLLAGTADESGGCSTLEACLRAFESPDHLSPHSWHCPHCKKRVERATKQMRIHRLPQNLLVHLKRFEYHPYGGGHKIVQNVRFPLADWRLSCRDGIGAALPDEPDTVAYRLYGVVDHMGSLHGGHYISKVLVAPTEGGESRWYEFDDSTVTRIDEARVQSSHAYLLFYTRQDASTLPPRASSGDGRLSGDGREAVE